MTMPQGLKCLRCENAVVAIVAFVGLSGLLGSPGKKSQTGVYHPRSNSRQVGGYELVSVTSLPRPFPPVARVSATNTFGYAVSNEKLARFAPPVLRPAFWLSPPQ
jgi:hypothetical protein